MGEWRQIYMVALPMSSLCHATGGRMVERHTWLWEGQKTPGSQTGTMGFPREPMGMHSENAGSGVQLCGVGVFRGIGRLQIATCEKTTQYGYLQPVSIDDGCGDKSMINHVDRPPRTVFCIYLPNSWQQEAQSRKPLV